MKNRRRIYLINKTFQLKFIMYTFVPSVFSLVIFYFSLNTYFSKLLDQGILSGLPVDHPYFSLIQDQKNFMNQLFIICSVYLFIFFIAWGLFISHKIAGPLYRLTKFFQSTDPGEFKAKISFRPNDFFQEIPTAINQWMDLHYRVPNNKQNSENGINTSTSEMKTDKKLF